MMFDVGIRLGYNATGKAINRYYRVHDTLLSESVRKAQDAGQYVFSIIALFRKKEDGVMRMNKDQIFDYTIAGLSEEKMKEIGERIDPIDPNVMIDPHGF